jgi:hypothetical protein
MSQKYPGGFITKSPVAPTALAASGMWTLDQAMQLKKQGLWPSFAVPGAPTIGTATQTGATTATVVYTAPASDGGTAITSYTATSSPSGGTGTLSQAGSGTITVTGLTESTSYTFTVTATNAIGTSAASAASNSITTPANVPTVIGQAFGGGFYAGQIGVSSVATHYIIVGPVASAQSSKQYKNANTAVTGADSDINGPQNTADMVAEGNATVYPAAHFCNDLVIGGFSDWYMPAKNELEIHYYNLKPTTTANNTGGQAGGINPNAVPARTVIYTSGDPAQTSVTAFKDTGAEDFSPNSYWASTEGINSQMGFAQNFSSGITYVDAAKVNTFFVRAIRRIPV